MASAEFVAQNKNVSRERCRCEKANEMEKRNERKKNNKIQNTARDSRNNNARRAQEKHFWRERKYCLFIYLKRNQLKQVYSLIAGTESRVLLYRRFGTYGTECVCMSRACWYVFFSLLPLRLQAINISSLNWEIERQSFHLVGCVCVPMYDAVQ